MAGNSILVVGVNAAGITSKMDSFDKLLFDLQPSIWMMQETKRKIMYPKMKTNNLNNYQVFELKREKTKEEGGKGLSGGGLAVGALHDLMPVLVRQGNDDVECMTVQVTTGPTTFRCVVGYGPHKDDGPERKHGFWNYLDQEVEDARSQNVGLVIQIDSNAWAGKEIIPNDPNPQNSNGKLLKMFLERNNKITLVNSLQLCQGLITRKRRTVNTYEQSVLDLFFVCDKMLPFVSKMHVDEQGTHQLTNFSHKHNKVTETDHTTVLLHIDLKFPILKPHRIEEFNFRSSECQNVFRDLTSQRNVLSTCFFNNQSFSKQISHFEHNFKNSISNSFFKIRTRKRKFAETKIGEMLETRKRLKLEVTDNPTNETKNKLKDIEAKIAQETQQEFVNMVKENLGFLTGDDGGINTNGVWKAKNRIIPKDKSSIPIAVKDPKGNFISSPEGIKELCLNEMIKRLRHRKIHPELKQLQRMKELLCKERLIRARKIKSPDWNLKELQKVLTSLKNNKCRDPQGLVNEIFKPDIAGSDLQQSLLILFNKTKETHDIPDMMKNVNIAMIPKPGKPNSHEVQNLRGIFIISIFRSIILKLLLKDESSKIDSFMSDASVGGRKGRRIQDHLFIVNGVIFEHARSKTSTNISINIYDSKQCYDSLWKEHIFNDLFEAGMQNDRLSLLWELDQVNKLAVKTCQGLSQRKEVRKIICQGDCWGTCKCSLHMDNIAKDSLNPKLEPFKYKNEVELPILTMVDDLISISESGFKTTRMNAFVNAKIASKKLQFGAEKCFVMHVGRNHEEYKNVELFVNGWSVTTVDNFQAGGMECEDILEENIELSHIESERYLGQIISSDSKNKRNILKLKNKGIGIQNKIINMLHTMSGGIFYFQIALIYRCAYLLSSILTSSEVWYGITQAEYEQLESADQILIKNIFQCSSSVPTEIQFLELGIWPIRFIIMKRRCLYLHHILQQSENSLLFRFFYAQLKYPQHGDWVSQIFIDLNQLNIEEGLEEIQTMSFKKYVFILDKQIGNLALKWLLDKKNSRKSENAKGKQLNYTELKMADYLLPSDTDLTIEEKKWIFKCRIDDIDVRANRRWQYEDLSCLSCNSNKAESQIHILECKPLLENSNILTYLPNYSDLFGNDLDELIYVARLLKDNFDRRIVE